MSSSSHHYRQMAAVEHGQNHQLLFEDHRVLGVNQWTAFSGNARGGYNHQFNIGRVLHIADVFMTWSAAGFVLGENGDSIRDIVAVSGADVSSRQGIWRYDGTPARWFQITSVDFAEVCRATKIIIGALQLFNTFVDRKRRYICIKAKDFTSRIDGVDFTFRPPSKNGACTPFRPSCELPPERQEILVRAPANSARSFPINKFTARASQTSRQEPLPTAHGNCSMAQNSCGQPAVNPPVAQPRIFLSPVKQPLCCQTPSSDHSYLIVCSPQHRRQCQLAGKGEVFKISTAVDACTTHSHPADKENCFQGHLSPGKGGFNKLVSQSSSPKAAGQAKALRVQLRALEMRADQNCQKVPSPVRESPPVLLLSSMDFQESICNQTCVPAAPPNTWGHSTIYQGSKVNFSRTPGRKCPQRDYKVETDSNSNSFFHSPLRSSNDAFATFLCPFTPTALKTPRRQDYNTEFELLNASAIAHFGDSCSLDTRCYGTTLFAEAGKAEARSFDAGLPQNGVKLESNAARQTLECETEGVPSVENAMAATITASPTIKSQQSLAGAGTSCDAEVVFGSLDVPSV